MTVKVYKPNGQIEEYPNAYIYWEWDDNEEGTDSGFRINSMDRNFTSVVAFIYPGECEKIEITSEECDRVFKSPPRENGIPVKRYKIFTDIHRERIRQDEKWGEQNHPMVRLGHDYIFQNHRNNIRNTNARLLREGGIAWSNILMEEVYEAFAETDPKKQREELVQVAAVAVEIIECLDRKKEAGYEKGN
jgi:hypothetical protein